MITANQARQANLDVIKRELPIPFVMEHYGHNPEERDLDGKLHYHSPFRNDDTPSFDVYPWRGRVVWGDLGDPNTPNTSSVIDLIQKFQVDMTLPQVIELGRDLLVQAIESDWEGPTVEATEQEPLDQALIQETLTRLVPVQQGPVWAQLASRPGLADVNPDARYVGHDPVSGHLVWILRDEHGGVLTMKFRREDGTKYAVKGGGSPLIRFSEPKTDAAVFLTEGETDTCAATSHLPTYEVVGLPGVSHHPEKLIGDTLNGRIVYLAFDPDTAGIEATQRWASYLADHECDVRVCILPEGRDICQLRPSEIQKLPERARVRSGMSQNFHAGENQYYAVNSEGAITDTFSNFVFEPLYVLRSEEGGTAYRGVLKPFGREVTLPAEALVSRSKMRSWCRNHGVVWGGSDYRIGDLEMLLAYEATFLPEGYVTDQVGLFDGTFVWQDDGQLGLEDKYFTQNVQPFTDQDIFIRQGPQVDRIAVFEAMLGCQNPSVTGPILSWLAAAPLRTRFDQFPILGVTGVSGTGKTTLTEEFLRVFSATNITTNLTSTTPFAIERMMDANNGFPLWFDEYRPGARKTAKDRLDQLLRDAYTGQPSAKGDVVNDTQTLAITRTLAPLLITGEESFTETSHLDRMVPVRLQVAQQGNLGALQDLETTGFAWEYLSSLQRPDVPVDDPPVFTDFRPVPVEGHNSRQGTNLAVLQIGWRLLEGFLQEQDPGYRMPDLDLDQVRLTYMDASASSPVLDLVRAAFESGMDAVSMSDDGTEVWVHLSALSSCGKMFPSIILPTKTEKGLKGVLIEQHGGEYKRVRSIDFTGRRRQVRVIALSLDEVGIDEEEENEHDDTSYPEI